MVGIDSPLCFHMNYFIYQSWWHTPVISISRVLRQGDGEFQASLDYGSKTSTLTKEGSKEENELSWAWWHMPAISEIMRLRQEDCYIFKVRLKTLSQNKIEQN